MVLAKLRYPLETLALKHRQPTVVEEGLRHFASFDVFWVTLHEPSAKL